MGRVLGTLAGRPKAELVETIGRLIARAPEGLAARGVQGFEEGEPEDPDAEGEDEWQ